MTIDVIVPTLGTRLAWLEQCLRSVADQDASDLRLLVVAPESSAVADIVAAHRGDLVIAEPRGLSAAVNSGLRATRDHAEFIAWIGDDDLLVPGSLARSVHTLHANPAAPFSYGPVRYIDEKGNTLFAQWPTRFAWRTLRYGQQHVAQPGSVMRASALRAIGMSLDERLKNAMDLDLFIRLTRLGRPAYVPSEVAAYRLHDGSITATKGVHDEAEDLRRNAQSQVMTATRWLWRPLLAFADRLFIASAWHLHKPSAGPGELAYSTSPR